MSLNFGLKNTDLPFVAYCLFESDFTKMDNHLQYDRFNITLQILIDNFSTVTQMRFTETDPDCMSCWWSLESRTEVNVTSVSRQQKKARRKDESWAHLSDQLLDQLDAMTHVQSVKVCHPRPTYHKWSLTMHTRQYGGDILQETIRRPTLSLAWTGLDVYLRNN